MKRHEFRRLRKQIWVTFFTENATRKAKVNRKERRARHQEVWKQIAEGSR